MSDVTVSSLRSLQNEVRYSNGVGFQTFITDEPSTVGGSDRGPDPYTMLVAALGSCISLTVTLYARRKNWPLERVTVRLRQERVHTVDCEECEHTDEAFAYRIERSVTIEGNLNDEQRARLQEIAHKCPVHKTLTSEIVIADWKD